MAWWPGISVIRGLEQRHLAFTRCRFHIVLLGQQQDLIKKHLIESHTSTPRFYNVDSQQHKALETKRYQVAVDVSECTDADPNLVKEQDELEQQLLQEEDKEQGTRNKKYKKNKKSKKTWRAGLSSLKNFLKFPLLVKPAYSSSSRGISTTSVVDTL